MEADSSMNAIAKNKTAPRPLLPRLRFAGFRGEWESVPLGSLGKFFRGLTYGSNDVADGGLLVLRSSNIQGGRLILDSDLVFVAKQCPSDLRLRRGDVVICMSNGSKALVGKSAELDRDYSGELTVGAFCSIFRPLIHFAKIAFDTQQYADFVSIGIAGGNINNLKNSDLEAFEFHIPQEEAEQQKIAACLSSHDTLITAQTQKLDTLKTHKKGLMQQLFPRAGETTPRLRFAEFQEAGEWETSFEDAIFSQISNKEHNSDLPVLAITQEHGAIPRDMIDYHVSVTDKSIESYKVVEVGDFIISLRSFQGGIEFSKYRGICSPAYVILRLTEAHSQDYFRHYLKTERFIAQMTKNLEGLRDGKMISFKQFSELELPIPQPAEQQKIAACLSSLDELITAQAQKVTALQTHKKGLLQQLFPAQAKASA